MWEEVEMSHEAYIKSIHYKKKKLAKRAVEIEQQIPKLRYSDFKNLLWEVRRLQWFLDGFGLYGYSSAFAP